MATRALLAVTPGSPFARMARVAIREWALPVEEVEVAFPPPAEVVALNPLGQVPVLSLEGEAIFPTLIILERLWTMAGLRDAAYDPARDRQLLATVLAAGDALVAASDQRWAGLGPVAPNTVGHDPAERHLAPVRATPDWLETNPRMTASGDGVTPPPIALACLMLWIEARGGLGWPVPPRLAETVAPLDRRESFRRTRPPAWRPDA